MCGANIASVREILAGKDIEIRAKALGDTERRSVSLNIENGRILFTEDSTKEN